MKNTLTLLLISLGTLAWADHIRYSNDVSKRFTYKDWVSYQNATGQCRSTSEFLIHGSVAELVIFYKGEGWQQFDKEPYRAHLYGEYVKDFELVFNGQKLDEQELPQTLLLALAKANKLVVNAEIYKKYAADKSKLDETIGVSAEISLSGSSAALRFCGFIE